MLVLLIGLAFQAYISVASLPVRHQLLLRDRTTEVKHLDDAAYSIVAFYYAQSRKHILSDAAARSAAIAAVRALRYDTTNYFFIWTLDGTGVAHGAHPEWEGKRFVNSAEAKKFPVVAEMVAKLIDVAQSPAGEGVTTYRIPKLGQTSPRAKIAYSRVFKPWRWSIGTGAYVDDIDATFHAQVVTLAIVFGALIGVGSVLTYLLGSNLSNALRRLSARVAAVADGEFDGEVPYVDRNDEVGVMARALLILRDNSREALAAVTLDQLTGLPNRKLLGDRLTQAMASSSRSGQYGGLMFLDLDKFKTLNDTMGHDVGDLLLREVAQRLCTGVRRGDTVARLGGDEFVLVVIDLGRDRAEAAATLESIGKQILTLLSTSFEFGNITHVTSGSIGLTLFKDDAASVEDVLKQADLAMYKAKDTGRNTCRFFDPAMEAVVRERAALEADLLRALADDQFQLHYQAQVSSDGRLNGAEALIRWQHPDRGLVPPDEFIPFAEETGIILALGKWVLEAACRQLVAWASNPGTADLTIAVNVSSRQFQQSDFVELVLAVLESSGADPRRLELELTESLLVDDVDDIIAKMLALRTVGVTFTLDDFGTGYSSLSYLKRMPLDKLKIDRAFVRDLLVDENDAAIARTVVTLARSLRLGVVAEGVETIEQHDHLVHFGCHEYQGYLFSRPLPVQRFEQFVDDWNPSRLQHGRADAQAVFALGPAG